MHATVVVVGLLVTGGAAYGVLPGELGHHGAEVVDAPARPAVAGDHAVGGASSIEVGDR
jgi:hypothetical protein